MAARLRASTTWVTRIFSPSRIIVLAFHFSCALCRYTTARSSPDNLALVLIATRRNLFLSNELSHRPGRVEVTCLDLYGVADRHSSAIDRAKATS